MTETRQRTIPVTENGRLNIPADMRKALGLDGAGRVILRFDQDGLHITTREHAIRRVRELMAPYVQEGSNVVADLIAERRAEAAREEDEAKERPAARGTPKTSDDV